MTAREKTFRYESEAAMCAAFIAWAEKAGWVGYPETCGWDVLLVGKDGVQIGVEAKQALNAKVLLQALDKDWSDTGPDYRAVLAPRAGTDRGLAALARRLHVTVIEALAPPSEWTRYEIFQPGLPFDPTYFDNRNWFDLFPTQRCRLPDFVPDCAAGVSAPLQLTAWKIGAIRIAILLKRKGYVTRADFKHIGVDHRRWTTLWLDADPQGRGWIDRGVPDFKAQHPRNWDEIEATFEEWAPKLGGLFGDAPA